jgi:hypothetical protein
MDRLSFAANILGILGAVFSLFAWLQALQIKRKIDQEERRQNRIVRVILRNGKQRKELPVPIRRAELTRSEVLGYIGMIPRKGDDKFKRFSLGYISEPEFFRRLNEIATSNGDSVLEISCTPEELDQFDFG